MSGPRSKKARVETYRLKIKAFERDYQFVHDYFEVMVWMHDENDNMKTGGDDLPLELGLLFQDNAQPATSLLVGSREDKGKDKAKERAGEKGEGQ